MKLDPPTHMKHERNGNSCSWAGLASQLALLDSCRLAWIGWLGWPARGREGVGRGSCETLWWRWKEHRGLSERAKVASIPLTSAVKLLPQGEEAMNLLLPTTKKRCLASLQHLKWEKPIQTHQNHVCWKEGTNQKGREQGLCGCFLKAVTVLAKSHKC